MAINKKNLMKFLRLFPLNNKSSKSKNKKNVNKNQVNLCLCKLKLNTKYLVCLSPFFLCV